MAEESQRPTTDDRDAWSAYWTALGMPWRIEPEISADRQAYLLKQRAIHTDIQQGVFPFRAIKLARADVEWLLVMHESGGVQGPVDWSDAKQRTREGLDLRAAILQDADLHDLPLTRLRAGLSLAEYALTERDMHEVAAAHMERANFNGARLEGAALTRGHFEGCQFWGVHCEQAVLRSAHLEGIDAGTAHFEGADLGRAYFSDSANLDRVGLANSVDGSASLFDVHWGGANLALIQWASVYALGDELRARLLRTPDGKKIGRRQRLLEHDTAVRANRQIAILLRAQGVNVQADRFAYRAQVLQRRISRLRQQWLSYVGSLLLDLIAGYGYRPLRSFLTYLFVISGFAWVYFSLGGAGGHALTWNEAVVVSMTAFHGRGFFGTAFQPGDPQAAVAAMEALMGLFIEITFIATFTQRFFAR
jgi:uncharacterized protein YjbI with pentapeptide repeats